MILRRADHYHFMDNVEEVHETVQNMPLTEELAWMEQMRPIAELCSGEQAHLFVRGLTLCHMVTTLGRIGSAQRFLLGDLEAELAVRAVARRLCPLDARSCVRRRTDSEREGFILHVLRQVARHLAVLCRIGSPSRSDRQGWFSSHPTLDGASSDNRE